MNLALGDYLNTFLTIYVDDLLITSCNFEEHLEHLQLLFERLKEYNLRLKFGKSLFCRDEVPYLGVILSQEGIRPDPEKIKVIQEIPEPRNRLQLQKFVGVCNYYRRFSEKHAKLIHPFRDLLSIKNEWKWTEDHKKAFEQIKQSFLNYVYLKHYIQDRPFYVQTDASDQGICGVLFQKDENDDERIVSLASRTLTQCEMHYTTTEKELLAITYAINKFRTYLFGVKFFVVTDHKALVFLLSTSYYSSRLTRWSLFLQQYNFTILHCAGTENIIADYFSRHFKNQVETKQNEFFILGIHEVITERKYEVRCLFAEKPINREIRDIGRMQQKDKRGKYNNVRMEGPYQSIIPNKPNEIISVDFYGPLPQSRGGVQYLLVVIDIFSKYVSLYPIKKATTKITLNKIINDYFQRVAKPEAILSDNGTQFTSKKWRESLGKENVRVIFSSVRHPQSNPVERTMRELGRFFRTFCAEQHTKWAKYVKEIENILNLTTHSSTGYIPYEIHYGESPQYKIKQLVDFPPDEKSDSIICVKVKENLIKSAKNRRKQQKRCSKVQLGINDLVLVRRSELSSALDKVTKKFFQLYEGPYKVKKIIPPNAYQLCNIEDKEKIRGTFNKALLKKYYNETAKKSSVRNDET
ncbi:PREDICTED: uncharacterized protein LOC105455741 [Wasmannia auropunctata]|uniref:uncharacterized protein LOC105455741 n=1 Tax=Wasmannia auropunctata TaxID=64793 RepID=UPI0005F07016|nr:PREDICTED: uncharacterized protein LOC105455741 [Wasmannia auropunctata]